MHRSFALFLCIVAQGAVAQCVAPATTMTTTSHPATRATVHAAAEPAQGIIKTAAAGTPDDAPPAVRESVRETPRNANGQDRPRRGGTAMLLAALALMSGIALRRYGASGS
ncbi:MAG TPA: hypothetical protein VL593_01700 [Ramlibacter sp.]|nr:hypothetical protein [Ramlibacter sp.]